MNEHLPSISRLYAPWMAESACIGHDPELWFLGNATPADQAAREHKAKTVCAACPVRVDCLTYAITHDDQWGLYGGLTPDERRKLGGRKASA